MTCPRCGAPERDIVGETARFFECDSVLSVDGSLVQSQACLHGSLRPVTSRVAYDSNDRVLLHELAARVAALERAQSSLDNLPVSSNPLPGGPG